VIAKLMKNNQTYIPIRALAVARPKRGKKIRKKDLTAFGPLEMISIFLHLLTFKSIQSSQPFKFQR
jgi:hypothetical protein